MEPMADARTMSEKWKTLTLGAYGVLAVGLIGLGITVIRQMECTGLVAQIEGDRWKEAQDALMKVGRRALPYLSRSFCYDDNDRVRKRSGDVIFNLVSALHNDVPAEQVPTWQRDIRDTIDSELVNKGLRDENPEIREIAAKIVSIIGTENDIEIARMQGRTRTEKLLALLCSDKQETVRSAEAELADMGEFPLPILVGFMSRDEEPETARHAAGRVLFKVLKAKYRADEREELGPIVGRRRAKILFRLAATGTPNVVEMLSLSPQVSLSDVQKAADEIQAAPDAEKRRLAAKYAAWHARQEAKR